MKVVLVADDEEALLEVFASVVTDLGHTVVCAHAGDEALGLARAHQPDLIVSDHMMPGLTGMEFLRSVRGDARLAQTPFILISAAQPQGAHEATTYLPKPVSLEAFERASRGAPRVRSERRAARSGAAGAGARDGIGPGARGDAQLGGARDQDAPQLGQAEPGAAHAAPGQQRDG